MAANDNRWTPAELAAISDVEEVHVSSRPADRSLSPGQTIWAVVVDGAVFIRSTDGPEKPWFRAAKNRGVGQFQAGKAVFDVTFHDAADLDQDLIEAEYRRKYRHRPAYNVNRAAGSTATLRLLPVRH
jgi:hypothetical protein